MWQRVVLLFGLVLATSLTASGQAIQLFGGYSYQRFDAARNQFLLGPSSPLITAGSSNMNGWNLSGRFRLISWLGGVADFAGHYGDGLQTTSFTFGPEINVPTRISPFFHVLVGGARMQTGGVTDTSRATLIGGGVDWRVVPFISWRVVEVDAVRTQLFGGTQRSMRASTGLVLRF